jgi:hypothetical protein
VERSVQIELFFNKLTKNDAFSEPFLCGLLLSSFSHSNTSKFFVSSTNNSSPFYLSDSSLSCSTSIIQSKFLMSSGGVWRNCFFQFKNYQLTNKNVPPLILYRSLTTQNIDLGSSVVVKHKVPPNYQNIPFQHLHPVDRVDENYTGMKVSMITSPKCKKREMRVCLCFCESD